MRQHNRQYHLARLWDELRQYESLPQLDRWLTNYFRSHKSYGRQDRRFYADEIFKVFRQAVVITKSIFFSENGAIEDRRKKSQAFLENYPDPTDLWPALRRLSFSKIYDFMSAKDLPVAEPTAWDLIHPAYHEPLSKRAELSHWSPEELANFLKQLQNRPPLWVRLNYPDRKEEILQELRQNYFTVQEKSLGSLVALALTGERGIFELNCFKKGLLEIQDFASQLIGSMVDAHPGMAIWDACAGGGGKTMLLAAASRGRGVIYASDIREHKLHDNKKRARKAGFFNVRLMSWDGRQLPKFPREIAQRQGFHRVLVDAPCSASGTWRRNPDAMLRFSLRSLSTLCEEQATLLQNAAQAVRPGGKLVYATCSWLPQENEAIVQEFLNKNPEFALEEANLLGSPYADSDTMFAARMLRQ